MNQSVRAAIARFRQPAYTGPNRCVPCTIVNVAIATAVCGVVFVGSRVLATALFALCLVTIYLRGYLVPGTPALTAQYLPEPVLTWFKSRVPASTSPTATAGADGDDLDTVGSGADATADGFDEEQFFRAAGILTDCEDVDDICLTDGFRYEWMAAVHELHDAGTERTAAASLLDVHPSSIAIGTAEARVGAHEELVLKVDGVETARWESRGAMLADLAAAAIVADREPAWRSLELDRAGRMLLHLRAFLDICPRCDGPMELTERTYDGCCGPEYTVESRCADCKELLIRPAASGV